ncbi:MULTISPECIES: hypothetical protein [unclassified Streptomyces]|uniref:hypothetical protein n=1 Tax=unclassified Streptomyces TaxID=2593676 RepID=UPI003D72B6B4
MRHTLSTRRPKALLHGWLIGNIGFFVLMAVVGGLSLDGAAVGLALYGALVLPPMAAGLRLTGKTPPDEPSRALRPAGRTTGTGTTPDDGTATDTEQAITRYGELLRTHPYVPGATADAEELADYRTALDVYEQAKRAPAAQVPALLARGGSALARLNGDDRPTADVVWNHGSGSMKLRLPRPATDGPAVLAFETQTAQRFSVHTRTGHPARRQLLLDGGPEPTAAHITVPPQDGDTLHVEVTARGPWRLALRPISEARRLPGGGRIRGRGTETVLKSGGPRVLDFEHHDDTPFVVRRLTRSLRTAEVLAEGRGHARLSLAVTDRCAVRVDSGGTWTLRAPKC